jgi:hypothetical protein
VHSVTRIVVAAALGLASLTLQRAVAQNPSAPTVDDAPLSVSEMPPPAVVKGYLQLGFDRLAGYDFVVPQQPADRKAPRLTGQEQIPDVVKSWDGKKAEIKGFMVPTKLEKGLVTEFLLLRDQSTCCYGASPSMNHFVVVRLAKGVRPVPENVVKVSGTFRVGTTFDAFGFMVGIYQFEGEKAVETKE